MSVFDDLGVPRKPTLPSFLKFQTCGKLSLGSRDKISRTEAAGVFFLAGGLFSDRDSGQTAEGLGDSRFARRV
jgi:hypothetical protein